MVFTLATYQVDPRSYDDFVRASEKKIWPALEGQGAKVIALWLVVLGGPERVLQMTRYDSLAHWQETMKWDSRGSGNAESLFYHYRGLAQDVDLIALGPLTRTQPEGNGPEKEPGLYTMRTFDIDKKDVKRLVELSEDGWWPWVRAAQGNRPVGQWRSIVTSENDARVYMISRYNDMAHWEATRGAGPEPTDSEMREIWEKGRTSLEARAALTRQTNVIVMRPLSDRRP